MSQEVESLLRKINEVILNPIIVFMFSVALIVFFYGIFQFILKNDDVASREKGKQSMVWGLVGMFIMVAVYGLVKIILNTFGVDVSSQFPFN